MKRESQRVFVVAIFMTLAVLFGEEMAFAEYYNYDQGASSFSVYNYRNGDWSFGKGHAIYPLQYPFTAIGRLDIAKTDPNHFGDWCTAWVMSSPKGNLVATAGHCVSDGLGHFYKNFSFTPGYRYNSATKKSEAPWGAWSVETFTTTYTFFNDGGRPLPNNHDDFAILKMRPGRDGKNVGYYTGSLGWVFNTSQRPIPVVTYDLMLSGYPRNVDGGRSQQICGSGPTDTEDFGTATSDGRESAFYHVGCHLKGGSSGAPYFTLHDNMAISVMSFGLLGEDDRAFMPWLGPYSLAIYDALAADKGSSNMSDNGNEGSHIVFGKPQGGLPKDIDQQRLAMRGSDYVFKVPDPESGTPRTATDGATAPLPPSKANLVQRSAVPPADTTQPSQETQ